MNNIGEVVDKARLEGYAIPSPYPAATTAAAVILLQVTLYVDADAASGVWWVLRITVKESIQEPYPFVNHPQVAESKTRKKGHERSDS